MNQNALMKAWLFNPITGLLALAVVLGATFFSSPQTGSNQQAESPPQVPSIPPFPESGKGTVPEKWEKEAFHDIILEAASRYQVDAALIKAVIRVESSYNPNAVSHKGAMGLMQLMPETARDLGVKNTFNPEDNINGGVRHLKKLMEEFQGDLRLALAAYNAGTRWVKKYQDIPPFRATRRYVKKVFEYYHFYRQEMGRTLNNV